MFMKGKAKCQLSINKSNLVNIKVIFFVDFTNARYKWDLAHLVVNLVSLGA